MHEGAVRTPLDRTLVRLHATSKLWRDSAPGSPEREGYRRRLDWLLEEYLRLLDGK